MAAGPAKAVVLDEPTINGLAVYRYSWTDSKGLKRTVSFKKEGAGNTGHGGFIVRSTFQYVASGVTTTVTANSSSANEGFGYFVSHERYRKFSDGASATIAGKIFKKDDSPLGRGFTASTYVFPTPANRGAIRFRVNYPRYGTVNAAGYNANTGEDSPPLGTNPAIYKLYTLPVTVYWYFADGADYPRVVTKVDMAEVPGPDRVSFDLRGPYGKLDFDAGSNPIKFAFWGDRYRFASITTPLTRNATWTWNQTNTGARYTALVAGAHEMGLVEPAPLAASKINDGYSVARGKTSQTYNGGGGCTDAGIPQLLPCDWEWPYQSAQYELPQDDSNAPTTSEKIAWGSTSLYGMSLTATYDGTRSVPFTGFPASKLLTYHVCLVFGRTQSGGLARAVADAGGTYNCSDTKTQ
ncbi:hypothetical protein [Methylobacterium sp. Leaf118]|uniref:hypothetical protein n=1 Tax=Methylobacterium sp. Leaf118 TaxID=2876562 RepID=UPI001E56D1F1|nr:hypothetical protein [Methylobacterium sp. Leaf118]